MHYSIQCPGLHANRLRWAFLQTVCIEGRQVTLDAISVSDCNEDMGSGDDEFYGDLGPAPRQQLLGTAAVTLEVSADIINYYMDYEPVYSPGISLTSSHGYFVRTRLAIRTAAVLVCCTRYLR